MDGEQTLIQCRFIPQIVAWLRFDSESYFCAFIAWNVAHTCDIAIMWYNLMIHDALSVMHIHTWIYMCTYIHTHVCIYNIYIYTYTCMHTYRTDMVLFYQQYHSPQFYLQTKKTGPEPGATVQCLQKGLSSSRWSGMPQAQNDTKSSNKDQCF